VTRFFLVLALLGAAADVSAHDGGGVALSPDAASGRAVRCVHFAGLERTRPYVLERELTFKVGAPLAPETLRESVQRLKNLQIFWEVTPTLHAVDDGVSVTLTVEEKWTLIPIGKIGGGEGFFHGVVGGYDVNVAGHLIEIGMQYEYLAGAHSGGGWLRLPRLGGRYNVGLDIGAIGRIRSLFDAGGALEAGFFTRRFQVNTFFTAEVWWWLVVGARLEIDLDDFDDDLLNARQAAANVAQDFVLPGGGRSVIAGLTAVVGRLDFEDWLVSGVRLDLALDLAWEGLGSEFEFVRFTAKTTGFLRLPWRGNLGGNLAFGHTTSDALQHLFYKGGLDAIRGVHETRLYGSTWWGANAEYRIPSLATSWLVIQHGIWTDIGHAGDEFAGLFDHAVFSAGTGIRLISPRVYRLVVRFDYAATFGPDLRHSFSFGATQFF